MHAFLFKSRADNERNKAFASVTGVTGKACAVQSFVERWISPLTMHFGAMPKPSWLCREIFLVQHDVNAFVLIDDLRHAQVRGEAAERVGIFA
jgi:hypothetical protein